MEHVGDGGHEVSDAPPGHHCRNQHCHAQPARGQQQGVPQVLGQRRTRSDGAQHGVHQGDHRALLGSSRAPQSAGLLPEPTHLRQHFARRPREIEPGVGHVGERIVHHHRDGGDDGHAADHSPPRPDVIQTCVRWFVGSRHRPVRPSFRGQIVEIVGGSGEGHQRSWPLTTSSGSAA